MTTKTTKTLGTFARFLVVGGIATATQYVILIFLVELFSTDPVLASAIGFILSAFVNYWMNYTFTFHSDLPHKQALPRFFVTITAGVTINTVSMHVFVNYVHLFYIIAQVLATGITLLWNFTVHSLWSFHKSGE